MQCEIMAIYSYPIKSCQGSSMKRANLSEFGIEGDRQLMVLCEGALINQLTLPALARVNPHRIDNSTIELRAAGHQPLNHNVTLSGETIDTEISGSKLVGVHQGETLAKWVSSVVNHSVEVVALKENFSRIIPMPQLTGLNGVSQNGFSDAAPILLTSQTSLADLNRRLEVPIPMQRFRPNIVIRGLDAWTEDDVSNYTSGNLKLVRQSHCERCAATCTDQETGERHREPLRTLRAFRRTEEKYASGLVFGAYMTVKGEGVIAVGDVLIS
jgi:uncharacterized protein YcbX